MRFTTWRHGAMGLAFAVTMLALAGATSVRAQDGAWSSLDPSAGGPGLLREHGAIFDRDHQRYIIFDGRSGNATTSYILFNDVWVLDVSGEPAWSHMAIEGPAPGQRHSPQWGYDPARNRILVFGGYGLHYPDTGTYEYLNDVWELSLSDTPHWTELFPAGQAPSGRLAGAAVYDPMRQRFVGFGGTIDAPVDTWVLDLSADPAWDSLTAEGPRPNGGWGMTSAYDAKRDRMLIFGGSTSDGYYGSNNDVWELDLRGVPQWHELAPQGDRPGARRSGASVYDPLRDRMVIYGGFDAMPWSDQFLGDAWALDFTADPPAWTALNPSGPTPVGRDGVPAAYDPLHDRMIVYGGFDGLDFLSDTQFLSWGGSSTEASIVSSAIATAAGAHVEWNVQNATGTHAAIYRRPEGGPWSARALAEVSASGHVTLDDAAVAAGKAYDYMLVVGSQRGETFGGQAAVRMPSSLGVNPGASAAFGLRGVAPNPAVDHLSVAFALRSSEPATLDLLDVTGRRCLAQDVTAFGAGNHRVDLSVRGRVPAGLYFLRLSQAGHTATSRVVVSTSR